MRAVRTVAGLFLTALGSIMLLSAIGGWIVSQHRDSSGAFTAQLAPIHTDGYAIVVPDVVGATQRHGVARLLRLNHVQVSAAPRDDVVLVLAPAVEVSRYIAGVSRVEVTGIGYASGAQPVTVGTVTGTSVPSSLPSAWNRATNGRAVEWTLDSDAPMSLLVVRADGRSDLTATLAVGVSPPWWGLVADWLLFAGAIIVLAGGAFLVWPGPRREVVLVVEPDQVADVADRLADPTGMVWNRGRRHRGHTSHVDEVTDTYVDDWESHLDEQVSWAEAGNSYVHTAT